MRYTKTFLATRMAGKKFYTGCIAALIIMMTTVVSAQKDIRISGTVINRETKEPVPYVQVYTKSFLYSTSTDESGKFSIAIGSNDTIVFSALGFDKYMFSVKKENIQSHYEVVIELDFRTYMLAPVKVSAYKNLEEFKQDILKMDVPTPSKNVTINLPKTYAPPPNSTGEPGIVIRGPVTALYNAFSKEGKELRKLETYRKQEKHHKLVESKYNADLVKRITNLSDEGVKRFMEWCKFEEDFILGSSEYDLTVAMLKCLDEFSKKDTVN